MKSLAVNSVATEYLPAGKYFDLTGSALVEIYKSGVLIDSKLLNLNTNTLGNYGFDVSLRISALSDCNYQIIEKVNDSALNPVSDSLVLDAYYKKITDGIIVDHLFSGDSTTQQISGTLASPNSNIFSVDGSVWSRGIFSEALLGTKIFAKGGSGQTLAAFASTANGSSLINSDSVAYDLTAITSHPIYENVGVYHLGWMTNDARQSALVAGQAYGSQNMITFASLMRSYFQTVVNFIRSKKPDSIINFRMPNSAAAGSTIYFINGVTAQNFMDACALTFCGDVSLGLPPITDIIPNSILTDIPRLLYSDTASTSDRPLVEASSLGGLHPTSTGYREIVRACLAHFNDHVIVRSAMSLQQRAANHKLRQVSPIISIRENQALASSSITITRDDIVHSDEYYHIGFGEIANAGTTFTDISFGPNNVFSEALIYQASVRLLFFGATTGSYASAFVPGLALDDLLVFKSGLIQRIRRLPDSIQGFSGRWFSGPPNGSAYYPSSMQGSNFNVYRHKYANSLSAKIAVNFITEGASAFDGLLPINKYYQLQIVGFNAGTGQINVMPYNAENTSGDFINHALSTSDYLCVAGADNGSLGISLSGAVFGVGSRVGEKTITLAGTAIASRLTDKCVLLSST
ncbi:MAG: hypothetical protein CTY18_05970 [Methylomonas sp.]|nr:MAG: hypothetical protein CTY18_05970 [Methylomonas sp.]